MIKKGDKVKILTGKDKKKEGEIIEIDRRNNRAKVKGINMVKKHVKTTKEKKGGIITKENFINISNPPSIWVPAVPLKPSKRIFFKNPSFFNPI